MQNLKEVVNTKMKISIVRNHPNNGVLTSELVFITITEGILRVNSEILKNNKLYIGVDLKKYFLTEEAYDEKKFFDYAKQLLTIVTSHSDGKAQEMVFLKSISMGLLKFAINRLSEEIEL